MQGGPGPRRPGREVYMIRRLVAVLVILLLFILLVTRACGAGSSSEKPTPRVPEKPSVTSEYTTNDTGETTEQGITSVSPP